VTPPNDPIFYIDESIASKILIKALRDKGQIIHCVGEVIPKGGSDEAWLKMCGEKRWIALTRDKKLRYRKLEKDSLVEFEVGAFNFSGGQATGQQTADRIVSLLPIIKQHILDSPRPFIFTFGLTGPISKVRLK
jgi:hypothetical protein